MLQRESEAVRFGIGETAFASAETIGRWHTEVMELCFDHPKVFHLHRTSLFSVVCALLSAVCDVNRQFVLTGILTAPGRSESRCLQNEIVEVFSGRKCAL